MTSFDAMAHSWTIRFLQHRIADKRILRLIAKWLKVGITEDGRVTRSERGTTGSGSGDDDPYRPRGIGLRSRDPRHR